MSIPLLEISPKTQNQRVPGYEVADEDDPKIYRLTGLSSETDFNDLIWAAYRQIFSEHLILESYRQPALESQLRNRKLSVRDFVRGLGKSEVYRQLVADTNSNYRLVDITFKRFLGRATYSKDEQIAWSIVIATQGLHGFIDAVVDSDEYKQNFGDTIIPYQRRRMEARPFNLVTPRYGDYWRIRQINLENFTSYGTGRSEDVDQRVRQAIPDTFLAMAGQMMVEQFSYQRTAAQAGSRAKTVPLPETTPSGGSKRATQRTPVSLPYRYVPATPKV